MLTHFYATGEELLGTHMIIEWRNKNNKNPLHANWKTSDDPGQSLGGPKGAFATLHGSMQRALDFEPEDIPVVKKRGPVVSTEKRSAAMKQYHSDLGKIQAKHPSWPHKKVREEYRKKRGKK
jgi:hypothetical protein